jgi:hypothetical protein
VSLDTFKQNLQNSPVNLTHWEGIVLGKLAALSSSEIADLRILIRGFNPDTNELYTYREIIAHLLGKGAEVLNTEIDVLYEGEIHTLTLNVELFLTIGSFTHEAGEVYAARTIENVLIGIWYALEPEYAASSKLERQAKTLAHYNDQVRLLSDEQLQTVLQVITQLGNTESLQIIERLEALGFDGLEFRDEAGNITPETINSLYGIIRSLRAKYPEQMPKAKDQFFWERIDDETYMQIADLTVPNVPREMLMNLLLKKKGEAELWNTIASAVENITGQLPSPNAVRRYSQRKNSLLRALAATVEFSEELLYSEHVNQEKFEWTNSDVRQIVEEIIKDFAGKAKRESRIPGSKYGEGREMARIFLAKVAQTLDFSAEQLPDLDTARQYFVRNIADFLEP